MTCEFKRQPEGFASLESEVLSQLPAAKNRADRYQNTCPSVDYFRRAAAYLEVDRVAEAREMLSIGDSFISLSPEGRVESASGSDGTRGRGEWRTWCVDRAQRERDRLIAEVEARSRG